MVSGYADENDRVKRLATAFGIGELNIVSFQVVDLLPQYDGFSLYDFVFD